MVRLLTGDGRWDKHARTLPPDSQLTNQHVTRPCKHSEGLVAVLNSDRETVSAVLCHNIGPGCTVHGGMQLWGAVVQILGWMDAVDHDVHLAALLRQGTDLCVAKANNGRCSSWTWWIRAWTWRARQGQARAPPRWSQRGGQGMVRPVC